MLPTQHRLKELFVYKDGELIRRVNKGSAKAGEIAGYVHSSWDNLSYREIRVDGGQYKAHRLVWVYVYGDEPENEIDHIDGDGLNNKINNLRDVPHRHNGRNRRLNHNSKTGVPGVSWNLRDKRYYAKAMTQNKQDYLYSGKDLFEAICSRKSWEHKNEFHFNHGRR